MAVVNETLVKKYFEGQDPMGKQINLGGKDTGMVKPFTIVGVLADQVDEHVGGDAQPFILLSQQQIPTTSLFYQALLKTVVSFVVKTRGNMPVAGGDAVGIPRGRARLRARQLSDHAGGSRQEHL